MTQMVMSDNGNDFLNMILSWEHDQKIMKEEDNRFVRAKMLVDGQDYIFFFSYRGNIYGANENARSVFSIMRNPMGEEGYKDMNFQATNLSKAMSGDPKEEIFIYKEINKIKVIQKQDAYQTLMGKTKKGNSAEVGEKMRDIQKHRTDRDERSKDGRIHLNKDFEEL
jgi:hypothetical protein